LDEKTTDMLGGTMRKQSFPATPAISFKFLQAYREAGVPVQRPSACRTKWIRNRKDTCPRACGRRSRNGSSSRPSGPRFARDKIDTKIWIIDHNYDLWGRALDILAKPEVTAT